MSDSPRLRSYLTFAVVGAPIATVNATSVIDERASLDAPIEPWRPWTWELTSYASWLLFLPLVIAAATMIRPPRFGLLKAAACHLAASAVVSLGHVGAMVGFRMAIYSGRGERYSLGDDLVRALIYEYRKDLVTYVAMVAIFLLIERTMRPSPKAALPRSAEDFRLELKDGSRTTWLLPEEVDWAEAAGNYVEVHGKFGTLLHRETLSSLEARLSPYGFVRIHRSRIVRAGAVASIVTKSSGDFEVTLVNGSKIGGSRRFRRGLKLAG